MGDIIIKEPRVLPSQLQGEGLCRFSVDSNQAQAEQVKLVIQVVIQKAAFRKGWESEQANVKCFKTNMCVCGHFFIVVSWD